MDLEMMKKYLNINEKDPIADQDQNSFNSPQSEPSILEKLQDYAQRPDAALRTGRAEQLKGGSFLEGVKRGFTTPSTDAPSYGDIMKMEFSDRDQATQDALARVADDLADFTPAMGGVKPLMANVRVPSSVSGIKVDSAVPAAKLVKLQDALAKLGIERGPIIRGQPGFMTKIRGK